MQPLPHHYGVTVTAHEQDHVEMTSRGLSPLVSAPPADFDGPGDLWSPETLTVAAVADCLALTFRAVATASKLKWKKFVCDADGTVDRAEGVTRFTGIDLHAKLVIPVGTELDKARKALEKAEKACLVGNSLKFTPMLKADITVE